MSDPRAKQVEDLFQAAADLPPDEREGFLRERCGDDRKLRAEVETLLEHEGSAARDFLVGVTSQPDRVAPGTMLEHYRIVRWIGDGGMGTVYEAEQDHPRRRVALKVIRHGMASPELVRRFRYEAEMLGHLQHPGIAQIFEAGAARIESAPGLTSELPFLAMELVLGEVLTRHADRRQLGTRERLELMTRVGDAVEHAHQKGIIHRDLKPDNILVVGEESQSAGQAAVDIGQPKILDFGVARTTEADLKATVQTQAGLIVGTLEYMSPEQISGNRRELDTRTDVYSLGVILYELVAGRTPFDLRGRSLPDVARTILEDEPPPLSAHNRGLRGDVEIIVTRAMAKEKNHRYASAAALTADIRRFLSGEPIEARRHSTFYVLSKTLRRHRILATSLTIIVVLLAAFAVVSSVQAKRINEEALEKSRRFLGPDDPLTLSAIQRLATLHGDQGDLAGAESLLVEVLGIQHRVLGEEHADTLDSMTTLATVYQRQGRNDAAMELFETTLELRRRVNGEEHQSTLHCMYYLAYLCMNKGQYHRAEPLCARTLELGRESLGAAHPVTLNAMVVLATIYKMQARHAEAEPLYTEALEIHRREYGETHPDTLAFMYHLSDLYLAQGRNDECRRLLAAAVKGARESLTRGHPSTAIYLRSYGVCLTLLRRYDEAEAALLEAHRTFQTTFGDRDQRTVLTVDSLVELYGVWGKPDRAKQLRSPAENGSRTSDDGR